MTFADRPDGKQRVAGWGRRRGSDQMRERVDVWMLMGAEKGVGGIGAASPIPLLLSSPRAPLPVPTDLLQSPPLVSVSAQEKMNLYLPSTLATT